MKQKYKCNRIQRGICLFLLLPLLLGIMISGMRSSTQALYDAWDVRSDRLSEDAWECEVVERTTEKEEKTGNSVEEAQNIEIEEQNMAVSLSRQFAKDKVLLGIPDSELNHVICLDDESMDMVVPRADEYQVWYAEVDVGQRQKLRISDTENATMLHTSYIINKNMKKGYPLKENLDSSGEHMNVNNDNQIYI